jgi:hypothetical protein
MLIEIERYLRARSPGGLTMGNSKIAIVAYCLAVGFILAVAFHSHSEMLVTASAPVAVPAQ